MTGHNKGEVPPVLGMVNKASNEPAVPGHPAAHQASHPSPLRAALLSLSFPILGFPIRIPLKEIFSKQQQQSF